MRLLPLLAFFALGVPTPSAWATTPSGVHATTASGLVVTADVRDEYLAGFPMLVVVTVRNDGATTSTFPDLIARPHLVHFTLEGPKGKSERHTTPPAFDAPTTWTIPARGERRVVVEVPSSGSFGVGEYGLTIEVVDPAGPITLPSRKLRLSPPRPVAGAVVSEPTIANKVGAMFPWVHQAAQGFDLYLMQYDARAPGRVVAQYALAHLDAASDPFLARSRPGDAFSRHVYWRTGANGVTVGRLDGPMFRAPPRTYTLPYPEVVLLDRGATDSRGGVVIPVWIPSPKGQGGGVRAWCINERGQQTLRTVVDLPERPTVIGTAIDAGSNLLLALGHGEGIDLYRVDALAAGELPAKGVRAWRAEAGWTPAAVAFDVLPDDGTNPGGLALLTLVTSAGPDGSTRYQSGWHDLSGKAVRTSPPLPWPFPGRVVSLLPSGAGPFYVLSSDGSGWWFGAQGGTAAATPAGAPGVLWANEQNVVLRRIGGNRVAEDVVMGPRQD